MIPWTVSEAAVLAAPRSARTPRVLLGVERVAARAREQRRLRLGRRAPAARAASRDEPRRLVVRRAATSATASARSACRRPSPAGARAAPGRAVATTSSGTPAAQSTRWSTKSSRPSSAQCRSSKTSTSGRCSASASKNRRQAANASARGRRRRSRPSPSPTSGRRCGSTQPRRPARPPRPPCELRAGLVGGVGLEDAGLRLDDLAERPERDAVAVGRQRPCRQVISSGSAVDALRRARRRAGSCRSRGRRRA